MKLKLCMFVNTFDRSQLCLEMWMQPETFFHDALLQAKHRVTKKHYTDNSIINMYKQAFKSHFHFLKIVTPAHRHEH